MSAEAVDKGLYNKTISCPVCGKEFEITRVKSRAIKVLSRDSDFCVHYEEINPLLYEAIVCENCGYSALIDKFEEISDKQEKLIKNEIGSRWNKRSFAGERNLDTAIDAFKLVLYNLHVRQAKPSEFAKVCLRIAWLYRFKKDYIKEKEFLSFALKNYNDAYQNERFPVDKLDESTCAYMIAELNRRVGNFDESLKWFSRLVSSPEARKNALIINNAREQILLLKDQMKDGGWNENRQSS